MIYQAAPYDIWHRMSTVHAQYEPWNRVRLDFDGRIDVAILRAAVTATLDALPLLTCRYVDSGLRGHWVSTPCTGDDLVRLVEVTGDPDPAVKQVFTTVDDPLVGPQTRITIVRTKTCDIYCQMLSHQICDGAGYKEYLYLLASLYTSLSAGQPLPRLKRGRRGTGTLLKTLSWHDKRRLFHDPGVMVRSAQSSAETGVDFPGGPVGPHLIRRVIPAEQLTAAKDYCHAHQATLNDLLMTLFARAWAQATGEDQVQVPTTMDLRKFLPPDANLGITNLAQACLCTVSIQPGDPLEQTLTQVREQMAVYKATDTVLRATLLWTLMTYTIANHRLHEVFVEMTRPQYLAFTNVGVFDTGRLVFGDVTVTSAYVTGALKPRPFFSLDVSSCNGECNLLSSLTGTDRDRQFIADLMDSLQGAIAQL